MLDNPVMRSLLACLIVLLAPASASASEVMSTESSVTLTAASGEANRVTIGYEGAQRPFVVKVQDVGAELVAGTGCLSTDAYTAQCVVERAFPVPNCAPFPGENDFCEFRADLGDADDALVVGLPDRWFSHVDLGAGNDALEGAAASYLFASGGLGDDRLLGGKSPDTLGGGPGADLIQGRGGAGDRVTYAEPERQIGVRVQLDDAPGDGAAGEGDDVRAEGIEGTAAADVLIGNDIDNLIVGNGGDDRIVCRGGVHDEAVVADLTDAALDCERVSTGGAYLDPVVDGPLEMRGRVVEVKVTPTTTTPGVLRVATLGGRRLGTARVPADGNGKMIRVRLRYKPRRTLPVRITGVVPGASLSRVIATLRP